MHGGADVVALLPYSFVAATPTVRLSVGHLSATLEPLRLRKQVVDLNRELDQHLWWRQQPTGLNWAHEFAPVLAH